MFELGQFNPQMKILWHYDRINEWLTTGDTKPILFEYDASNACNQKCIWCTFDYLKDKSIMSWDMMRAMILDMSRLGTKAINWTGGGEPLCNPHVAKGLELAHSLGIENGFYTNGQALNDEIIEAIVKTCSWIRISLDAGTAETYSKCHGVNASIFDKVLSNMKKLSDERKRTGSNITLGAGMLIHPLNLNEISLAIERVKNLEFDYFQIKPVVHSVWDGKQLDDTWWKNDVMPKLEMASHKTTDRFKVLVSAYKFYDIVDKEKDYGRNYKTCYSPLFMGTIGADGTVWNCCHLRGFKKFAYGNLKDKSLLDIWQSKERQDALNAINFKICQPCCKNHEANKMLWHIKTPKQEMHPNFL